MKAKNIYLWTALSCAAAHGWTKCVNLLIQSGASLSSEDRNRNTALHLSAKYGHHTVVASLIEAGASLGALSLSLLRWPSRCLGSAGRGFAPALPSWGVV